LSREAKRSISRRVTDGAKREPPAETTRIADSNCSSGASFSRNPLAPTRSAANTYSSRSKVVSTSTRGASARSEICRVASMPSTRGMRTSINTTSGFSVRAVATASIPSPASPTTSSSGSDPRIILKPERTSRWSSAIRTRITAAAAL
jgi:hypothetical protein